MCLDFFFFCPLIVLEKETISGATTTPKLLQVLKNFVIVYCSNAYNVEKRKLNYVFEVRLNVLIFQSSFQ